MQTPSAAKKSAAKSVSPPVVRLWLDLLHVALDVAVLLRLLFTHGQTLTKSKLLLLPLTISHLTQNIPTVWGHRVFLVDLAIRPWFLFVASCWCQCQRQKCRTQHWQGIFGSIMSTIIAISVFGEVAGSLPSKIYMFIIIWIITFISVVCMILFFMYRIHWYNVSKSSQESC